MMNKEEIEDIIRKVRVAMYEHTKAMYDYDMLVNYELDYNQWKQLLQYIEDLQQRIDKAIEYINGAYEMACYTQSVSLEQENIEDLLEILGGKE